MPYPEVPATLGDHLRRRRHERGLLQRDAADRLGVNTSPFANWEEGYTKPALRFCPGIIEFPGVRPEPGAEQSSQRPESSNRWRESPADLIPLPHPSPRNIRRLRCPPSLRLPGELS
jgi:transcriptional regulator with XRE-family HTH domain